MEGPQTRHGGAQANFRERVLAAVAGGATHRQAAHRFGVSAPSVSRWRAPARGRGDARPKALGGDRRSQATEAHRAAILELVEANTDITLAELKAALETRGGLNDGL